MYPRIHDPAALAFREDEDRIQVELVKVSKRKRNQINRVKDLAELTVPPGNRLERLRSDRSGQHSIRINDQYRVCFRWEAGDVYEVEITDYH